MKIIGFDVSNESHYAYDKARIIKGSGTNHV
jgi:hypothetical protein